MVYEVRALGHSRIAGVFLVGEAEDADRRLGGGASDCANLSGEVLGHEFGKTVLLMCVHVQDALPILGSLVLIIGIKNMNQGQEVLVEAAASKAWSRLQIFRADS